MPESSSIEELRAEAQRCTACPLYRHATQVVFGAGDAHARVMLVGEQPGDREDIEGLPFVGPAGQLLDRALDAAGIERPDCYLTNVVKHFKWEPRGKRRLHKTPGQREIEACRRWLVAEIEVLQPRVLICLGATAAKAMLGPTFRVTRDRGKLLPSALVPQVLATVHPSAVLRAPGAEQRADAFQALVSDLTVARDALTASRSGRHTRDGAR
jgi:uracil-DNA glycosylase